MHVAHLVLTHAMSVASFVLALLLIARAGVQRRPTGSTMAWLLAIVLVPYLGVPLYLLLGGRKLRQRAGRKAPLSETRTETTLASDATPLARMLCASGASAPSNGNRFELLTTGEASFAAVIAALEGAERSICVSTLILADDPVGRAIAEALGAKARSGVQVRLLIDALFEFRSSRRQVQALRTAGIHVAWFMPLGTSLHRGNANLRLHRKSIVIDDRLAIVGGMNLAQEYMGPVPRADRWRDLSATVEGPAVADIVNVFRADWRFAAGEEIATVQRAPVTQGSAAGRADVSLQVVGSGPDAESDRIYDAVLTSVFAARRRLWISTPYFVPDEALARALALAVRRGVDVCIVMPLVSNHRTADLAGAPYVRELENVGARVRRYQPGMLHAKLVLVDDDLAIFGSANMDMRSFFLDYELALFVDGEEEVAALATWFEGLLPRCVDTPPASAAKRLVESVARLLAPLE